MLLDVRKSSLLLIDVQQRLLPAMAEPDKVVQNCAKLLQIAQDLKFPVTVSEQYPKGLGKTVSDLSIQTARVFEKTAFSCWRDEALKSHLIELHETGRPQVIVAGIEAHVCVLQSCIDLANAGFGVFAVEDATSSRKPASQALAMQRLSANGVHIVNLEMVLFELLEKAGTPEFKALSPLIR